MVLLLDVFKGVVLHATSFEGARGPAHLALTENWLAVHFRNRKQKRFEIAMLEFFDAGSGSPDAPFSSLDAPLPIVYNRTYVYPDAVTALAVTTTMQVGVVWWFICFVCFVCCFLGVFWRMLGYFGVYVWGTFIFVVF
jgi:hypothetical protein